MSANVVDALGDNVPYLLHASADPTKNDCSEIYDVLRKPGGSPKLKEAVRRRKDESDEALEARKTAARETLRAAYPAATIFQPSVIFGRGDSFMTLFARLLKLAPVVPLAGADARFQPVWVEDVVSAIVASLDRPASQGQTYPLCGPRKYKLREELSPNARPEDVLALLKWDEIKGPQGKGPMLLA